MRSKTFISLIALSPFTKELTSIYINGSWYDLVAYGVPIVALIVLKNRHTYNRSFIAAIFVIFSYALFRGLILNYFELVLKVLFPIILVYLGTNTIFARNAENPAQIFEKYCQFSYFASLFGLFQFISTKFGFFPLGGYQGIDSLAFEPSHFACIIGPAFYYYLHFNYRRALVLGSVLLLTFSFSGYLLLLLAVLFFFWDRINLVSMTLFSVLIFGMLFYLPERVKNRVEASGNIELTSTHLETDQHLTVLSFQSNWMTALNSLKSNFILGSGIAGHSFVYDQTFVDHIIWRNHNWYGINKVAAHSLGLRVLSELGLLGVWVFVFAILRAWKVTAKSREGRIVLIAVMIYFIGRTLKLGSYIDSGTPIFFLLLMSIANNRFTLKVSR